MKKYEKIYHELRKEYTDEEIAESILIPADLTAEEKAAADEEMKAFRFKLLQEQTEEQRIFSELVRLEFLIADYVKSASYHAKNNFSFYLKAYINIFRRTKKQLSEELAIHYTKFSRFINDKELPNVAFLYRLEAHSGGLISALLWWKLVNKKQEFLIKQNKTDRAREAARVKNALKMMS